MTSRVRGRAIAVAMVAAIFAMVASFAAAEPGKPEVPAVPENPDHGPVNEVASSLMAHESALGFGRVEVDYETSTVKVFWKGEPTPEVQDTMKAEVPGVKVVLVPAKVSLSEVLAAGQTLQRADEGVTAVMPNDELSGIIVEVDETSRAWSASDSTTDQFAALVGMPVELRAVPKVTELTR